MSNHFQHTVSPTHQRTRRGFTMIELLMVVLVSGAMMAIVVPKFRISPETEVQLAAMQLAQDIDVARTRALSTRSMVRVAFGPTARNYSGYLDDDANGVIAETIAERTALRGFATRTLPVRVDYGRGTAGSAPNDGGSGAITFPSNEINFDSRGLATPMGTGGAIYLTHEVTKSAVAAVVVSPAGAVRLWTWRDGSWK
jgi:prepilin-type N-terminal cleavage/methylation domain-containing protein